MLPVFQFNRQPELLVEWKRARPGKVCRGLSKGGLTISISTFGSRFCPASWRHCAVFILILVPVLVLESNLTLGIPSRYSRIKKFVIIREIRVKSFPCPTFPKPCARLFIAASTTCASKPCPSRAAGTSFQCCPSVGTMAGGSGCSALENFFSSKAFAKFRFFCAAA